MAILPNISELTVIAVIADHIFVEPSPDRHVLVIFGKLANRIERTLNTDLICNRYVLGVAAWLLAVSPPVLFSYVLIAILPTPLSYFVHATLLWFSLGARSLADHVYPIVSALIRSDLYSARILTSRIVSRNTENSDEHALASATIESILENGNDAIFSTLFWFIIGGGPGALMFRLANTLDAMWGYKIPYFLHFGYAAARIDDLMNWLPARLTAISYSLLGDTTSALRCWNIQAYHWNSPNAGLVMAAGAGSLNIHIGGPAVYHGTMLHRPILVIGVPATTRHIITALMLVKHTLVLWLALLISFGMLTY